MQKPKKRTPNRASRGAVYPGEIIPEWRAKSSWNAERDQIGMVGDIIAIRGRLPPEMIEGSARSRVGHSRRSAQNRGIAQKPD
jgi:hypothetical protein